MSMLLKEQYMQMAEVEKELMELRKGAERNEAGMIRFNDEKGNTKLVVSADRVISLESAGNYVNILYDNDGKLVRYSLRNTLKGIEKVCNSNGLIRCHRSYFVNLNKIKVIRRTSEGVYAEMDVHNVGDIPVSKTYASDLLRLFSES
jgi:DNA-binding LytR/AlgR family response regulator